jgi:hypothetical protein
MKQWGSAGTFKRLDTGTTLYGTRVSRRTMARVVFPFLNPVLAAVIRDIDQITGFGLSEADEEPFFYFMRFLARPASSELLSWRADDDNRYWFDKVFKIVHDTQSSFACVNYHYANIYRLESEVRVAVERHDFRSVIGDRSVFSGGNTRKLDFEYQAYVLAYRRCLEYLAIGLCGYFRIKSNSFKRLPRTLQNVRKKDRHVAAALSAVHANFVEELAFVLSAETGPHSTRDLISHYEYVDAGVVNLTPHGFVLAGGGEGLLPRGLPLTQVLSNRLLVLRECISQFIHTFVDSIEAGQPDVGAEPLR